MKQPIFYLVSLCCLVHPAYATEASIQTYLGRADISIPYYGKKLYGKREVKLFRVGRQESWLIHQSRYGGDGESTPNILMIFDVSEQGVNKLFQYNMSNVRFHKTGEFLSGIEGEHITTLCDVCDGWEVAPPRDIFKIPILINVPSLRIEVLLNGAEKDSLISRLKEQVENNIKEQSGYGNKQYPAYAREIQSSILNLIKGF